MRTPDSAAPMMALPDGSSYIARTASRESGEVRVSQIGRPTSCFSVKPVMRVVARLTRSTVPAMSATMIRQGVVSRVMSVRARSARRPAVASRSVVTSRSWALNIGSS